MAIALLVSVIISPVTLNDSILQFSISPLPIIVASVAELETSRVFPVMVMVSKEQSIHFVVPVKLAVLCTVPWLRDVGPVTDMVSQEIFFPLSPPESVIALNVEFDVCVM